MIKVGIQYQVLRAVMGCAPLEEDGGKGQVHARSDVEVENVGESALGCASVDDHDAARQQVFQHRARLTLRCRLIPFLQPTFCAPDALTLTPILPFSSLSSVMISQTFSLSLCLGFVHHFISSSPHPPHTCVSQASYPYPQLCSRLEINDGPELTSTCHPGPSSP